MSQMSLSEDDRDEDEIDWSEYVPAEDEEDTGLELSATDYVALFIAALETVFLPLVILAVVLVALAFIFALL